MKLQRYHVIRNSIKNGFTNDVTDYRHDNGRYCRYVNVAALEQFHAKLVEALENVELILEAHQENGILQAREVITKALEKQHG